MSSWKAEQRPVLNGAGNPQPHIVAMSVALHDAGHLTVQSLFRGLPGRRAPSRQAARAGSGGGAVLRHIAESTCQHRRLRALVASCVLTLLAAPAMSRAEPLAVTWAIYDAPPFMIDSGTDAGNGIFDRIRQLLDAHLPELPAHTLQAPFPRVLASLRDGAELCFIGGVETPERDAYATFSPPVAMFYPLRIVVHAPERQRLEVRGPLSLPGIARRPEPPHEFPQEPLPRTSRRRHGAESRIRPRSFRVR